MNDWTKRLAMAALLSFLAFFFALPISCCGFVLYNQHVYRDVERGGPQAILRAMGVSAVLAICVFVFMWRRSRPR